MDARLEAALTLFAGGWAPLPMPDKQKAPPPEGTTGRGGRDLTEVEIRSQIWSGNIAVRVPMDVIGLDVDAYKGGLTTLAELRALLGDLPPTWISHSSRDDGSGIRLYRVPPGMSWISGLPGIEIIQHDHRYAMTAPSIHPEGRVYAVWDQTEGANVPMLPPVADLPDLPWAWIAHLSRADAGTATEAASLSDVDAFLDSFVGTDAATHVHRIVPEFVGKWRLGHSRHDTMQHCLTWAFEECRAGLAPAAEMVAELYRVWAWSMEGEPERQPYRHKGGRVSEFDAMMRHAVGKVLAKSDDEIRKIHDDAVGPAFILTPPSANGAEPDAEPSKMGRRLVLTPASQIKMRAIVWLWEGRIARGTLALVSGREGIGKSTLAYQLAADVTKGRLPGRNLGAPKGVLICATEDSWEHTIVPRLRAADADLDRVHRIEVIESNVHTALSLPRDLLGLEQAVALEDVSLIVLDPLLSRLDSSLDTHKDSEVRAALEPLVAVGDRTGAAIMGLIHLNKGQSTDPLTMMMGSRAFAAVARSVLFVAVDPDDESGRARLMGQSKNNLGVSDLPLRAFLIESVNLGNEEGTNEAIWTSRIVWGGDDPRSIADVLRGQAASDEDRSALAECQAWLLGFLGEFTVAESKVVKQAANDAEHSSSTLKRARKALGVGVVQRGFPRRTWWAKPGMTPDEVDAWLAQWDQG